MVKKKCVSVNCCVMQDDCAVVGCVLSNPLIYDKREELRNLVVHLDKKKRLKYIIEVLQDIQPPKVRRTQIDRYFLLKKRKGVDLDKWDTSKKEIKYQTNLKHVSKRKKIKIIIPKKRVKKEAFYDKHCKEISLSVNTNTPAVENLEYTVYLQNQTPEQFRLAQKHGWRIAKALTEPQENFHEQ